MEDRKGAADLGGYFAHVTAGHLVPLGVLEDRHVPCVDLPEERAVATYEGALTTSGARGSETAEIQGEIVRRNLATHVGLD